MATCRQIYHESSKVFYSENIFLLDRKHSVQVQVQGSTLVKKPLICPDYTKFIRQVAFPIERIGWWVEITECTKVIQHWPALQTLHILLSVQSVDRLERRSVAKGQEEAIAQVVIRVRNVCYMHDLRLPKQLDVKLGTLSPVPGSNLKTMQTILDEALKRVRQLRRL
jgi:hypothetical protein